MMSCLPPNAQWASGLLQRARLSSLPYLWRGGAAEGNFPGGHGRETGGALGNSYTSDFWR